MERSDDSTHVSTVNNPAQGRVTGTVKLRGAPTQPKHIIMTQDPVCSKLYPTGATDEEVVSGANGALANVVVYAAEGSGDVSSGISAPGKGPAVINQKGCMYRPRVLALQVNQKLQVVNSDATTHNIHPMPKNNREWNKSQPPGSSPLEQNFAREENCARRCSTNATISPVILCPALGPRRLGRRPTKPPRVKSFWAL